MLMVDMKAERRVLEALIDQTFKAEAKQDLKTVLEYFAEDVIVQGAGMPQFQGMKALKEFYTGFLPTLVTIDGKSTHLEISPSGDMAWDVGWNQAEYKGPNGNFKDKGKYFAVYKKVNGKWKCAAIAFSGDNPP
jgi:uncharacterized protein (TIGR02246 family)